jgi:hypothetical protein
MTKWFLPVLIDSAHLADPAPDQHRFGRACFTGLVSVLTGIVSAWRLPGSTTW